jgi:hypothetical protein
VYELYGATEGMAWTVIRGDEWLRAEHIDGMTCVGRVAAALKEKEEEKAAEAEDASISASASAGVTTVPDETPPLSPPLVEERGHFHICDEVTGLGSHTVPALPTACVCTLLTAVCALCVLQVTGRPLPRGCLGLVWARHAQRKITYSYRGAVSAPDDDG